MEKLLPDHPAVEIEERYRGVLKDNRPRDAAAGRTLDGPHLTDLTVIYAPKNISAAGASTGEQKALLIGLVLAHGGLLAEMTGFAPVLLLDEVVAHLDPARRAALYDALGRLMAASPAARSSTRSKSRLIFSSVLRSSSTSISVAIFLAICGLPKMGLPPPRVKARRRRWFLN
jgi:hypothetical protein